ncbi:MAG TPA: type II toxin-antitoxin system VapC family toxin, partial [Thermoanaerobaculia bacterium]|nr:type II toxin-antitoxin system VapC family toxin [Thermoanaerobaculia bacterium]
ALPVLAFDEPSCARSVALRRRLESKGRGIGMADYLIAGVCLCRDAALWTRNRKHFERVSGLRLV